MNIFSDLDLSKQLQYAIDDLGFTNPTPIQQEAFSVVRSGKDMVGIAQTGTGKTFAYMLPILRDLKFLKTQYPRVLILVPTRELVLQVVEEIEKLAKYSNVRVVGVYGGTNINTQKHFGTLQTIGTRQCQALSVTVCLILLERINRQHNRFTIP